MNNRARTITRAPGRRYRKAFPLGDPFPTNLDKLGSPGTPGGGGFGVSVRRRRMRGPGGQLARQREYRLRVSATSFGKADIVSPQANIVCAKHNLVRRRRHRFRRQTKISPRAKRAFPPLPSVTLRVTAPPPRNKLQGKELFRKRRPLTAGGEATKKPRRDDKKAAVTRLFR